MNLFTMRITITKGKLWPRTYRKKTSIFLNYIYQLLDLLEHNYKKISVIIPNYNYEKYLPARIESILNQTYPLYELIFLDDASTDHSVSTFKKLLSKRK